MVIQTTRLKSDSSESSCVALAGLLGLSELQFPYIEVGIIILSSKNCWEE